MGVFKIFGFLLKALCSRSRSFTERMHPFCKNCLPNKCNLASLILELSNSRIPSRKLSLPQSFNPAEFLAAFSIYCSDKSGLDGNRLPAKFNALKLRGRFLREAVDFTN